MDIYTLYLAVGCIVSFMAFAELEANGITGDDILSMLPLEYEMWLREHLFISQMLLLITFVVMIFTWPYLLYKLWLNNEK